MFMIWKSAVLLIPRMDDVVARWDINIAQKLL